MSNLVTHYNFAKSDTTGNYRDAFPTSKQHGTYLINKVNSIGDATILSNISDLGTDRNGPNGLKCLWLDQKNQAYVQLNPITSTNNGISFATWVLCESNKTWARIFDFGNGSGKDNIIIFINNNDIGLSVITSAKTSQPYGIIPKVTTGSGGQYSGQWFHIAWTLNPNGEWKIYVNGVLNNTLTGQTYPSQVKRNNMFLGKSNWSNDPYFTGYITDFRIYNSILSQNDVMTIYNGSSKLPEYDTDVNWKWTWNTSNNTWVDLKQNNLIGRWSDLGIDNNTDMTISFSIKINNLNSKWRNILHITNDGNNCCNPGQRIPAVWIVPNDTRLHFRFSSADIGNNGVDSKNPIGLNKETYITLTISKSIVSIYYNGQLDNSNMTNLNFVQANKTAMVYIANPWHICNGFIIKNLKMTNRNIYDKIDNTSSYDATQNAWIFPKSIGTYYSLSPNTYYTNWSNLGIKSNSNMTISFTINIGSLQQQRWRSILHVSNSGNNLSRIGDRIPGIWLRPERNQLYICFSTNNSIEEVFTSNAVLPFSKDCQVTIIYYNNICYLYIDNNFDRQHKYSSPIISADKNAIVYVCDPWHDAVNINVSRIKDLKIINGNTLITPPDNVGIFKKKGCFNDKSSRSLPNYRGNIKTPEDCANLATSNNDTIFGVQNRGECWTGRSNSKVEQYGKISDDNCIMNGAFLGGTWTQFVYEGPSNTSPDYKLSSTELDCYKKRYPDLANLNNNELQTHWTNKGANQNRNNQCPTVQQTSGLYNYKGAYNDQAARAIPTFVNQNITSVDQCQSIAEANKQTVFGVQNGNQCFTGNNESNAYQYGEVYDGNKIGALGSPWTNMVYVRSTSFPDPAPDPPNLTSPNFSDNSIESFDNNEDLDIMIGGKISISKKICGLILLIFFIIVLLIISKVKKM